MVATFPGKLKRSTKRSRGRTPVEATPIAIRSSIPIEPVLENRIRRKLVRRLGHAAPLIERGTVRFEDINGPRGGVDTVCRIKLVVSGRPSVQAQDRASDIEPAFDLASHKVQRALERVRGKHGLAAGRAVRTRTKPVAEPAAEARAPHRLDRAPMKLETARRPPSRKGIKAKARHAKRRVGVQRAASRR